MSDDAHRNPIVPYAGTFWRELSGPGVGTEIWTTHAFQLGERQMGSSSGHGRALHLLMSEGLIWRDEVDREHQANDRASQSLKRV